MLPAAASGALPVAAAREVRGAADLEVSPQAQSGSTLAGDPAAFWRASAIALEGIMWTALCGLLRTTLRGCGHCSD